MLIYYHETPGLEKSSPLTNLESQSVSSVALFSSTRSFTPPGSLKVYRQRKHTCNRRFVWTNALSVFLMVVILLNALVLYKSGTLKDLRNYKWKESMVRNPDLVLEKFKNTVNSDKYIDDGLHGIKGLDVLENLDEDDLWLN